MHTRCFRLLDLKDPAARVSPGRIVTGGFLSVLAIVPIEYFSERHGSSGHVNGTKIKSMNEENRV